MRSRWAFGATNVPRILPLQKKVCNFVGGVASPWVANIALHGLEEFRCAHFPTRTRPEPGPPWPAAPWAPPGHQIRGRSGHPPQGAHRHRTRSPPDASRAARHRTGAERTADAHRPHACKSRGRRRLPLPGLPGAPVSSEPGQDGARPGRQHAPQAKAGGGETPLGEAVGAEQSA
jgi:hypothetical protein